MGELTLMSYKPVFAPAMEALGILDRTGNLTLSVPRTPAQAGMAVDLENILYNLYPHRFDLYIEEDGRELFSYEKGAEYRVSIKLDSKIKPARPRKVAYESECELKALDQKEPVYVSCRENNHTKGPTPVVQALKGILPAQTNSALRFRHWDSPDSGYPIPLHYQNFDGFPLHFAGELELEQRSFNIIKYAAFWHSRGKWITKFGNGLCHGYNTQRMEREFGIPEDIVEERLNWARSASVGFLDCFINNRGNLTPLLRELECTGRYRSIFINASLRSMIALIKSNPVAFADFYNREFATPNRSKEIIPTELLEAMSVEWEKGRAAPQQEV